MEELIAYLIDDGTMDTVIQVKDKVYRYNMDESLMGYNEFIDWASADAVAAYKEEQCM